MKILIVEDDARKLQLVANTLRKTLANGGQIETAHDVTQAKRLLASEKFDVAVFDMSLPPMAGDEAKPLAGLDLLEEICRRERYKKPTHIIGLTAYPDLYERVLPRFKDELWHLVQFDPTSEEWADQLGRKIKYIEVAVKSKAIRLHQSDLCVVAALRDPELNALIHLPWDWKETAIDGDAAAYFEGCFSGSDGLQRRVIAAHSPEMGMTSAAILATKMIHTFAPRYLAMVGICAGMKGKCQFGDIICVDPCWDWGAGKFVDNGGKSKFLHAPSQLRLDSFVRAKLAGMSADQGIWDRIKREWPGGGAPVDTLRMHLAPLASGAAVLSDLQTAGAVKVQHRQLAGIDMEAYGIFASAAESVLPQPKALVLKSVVDFANPKKNDKFREYAAYTSARALQVFAETAV